MSLQETYQSCKNLIATNLNEKGVPANGNMGLTTLANKILEITTTNGGGSANFDVTCDTQILYSRQNQSTQVAAELTYDGLYLNTTPILFYEQGSGVECDGEYVYIPFDCRLDWDLGDSQSFPGGSIEILDTNKTFLQEVGHSDRWYLKCKSGSVSMGKYMQDPTGLIFPPVGFFKIPIFFLNYGVLNDYHIAGFLRYSPTNSIGIGSCVYQSRGAGEVTIIAKAALSNGQTVQGTCTINDLSENIVYFKKDFVEDFNELFTVSSDHEINIKFLDELPKIVSPHIPLTIEYTAGGLGYRIILQPDLNKIHLKYLSNSGEEVTQQFEVDVKNVTIHYQDSMFTILGIEGFPLIHAPSLADNGSLKIDGRSYELESLMVSEIFSDEEDVPL